MRQIIGFGGGCHWCTEAVFQTLKGVRQVEQGWIASLPPDDRFSEAVLVHFDRSAIAIGDLIDVHLHTHASGSAHSIREKYRSAIYTRSDAQAAEVTEALARLAANFRPPPVTRVLPFQRFRPSREEIACYYLANPARPFCRDYIEPKLRLVRERFPQLVTDRELEAAQPFGRNSP